MAKERILVTVKTYPTLSTRYGETVCTAGVRPDGSWVRIYPVPFRRLEETEQYRKFDWLDLDLIPNPSAPRPETFRPTDGSDFEPVAHMDTKDAWRDRRRLLLETSRVYTNLATLIADAKENMVSLAVFKPTRVIDLRVEEDEREWKPERVEAMRKATNQFDLFSDDRWRETFKVVRKMPWKWSYRFEDDSGKQSTLQILDWEIGALYWNCLRRASGDEAEAKAKVRVKYIDGRKSSILVVAEDGDTARESITYEREDFWASTTNKQLNFVQHVKSLLQIHGRAAVVVPDNVLFEGGAGETIRRKLLHECDVHTLLRLPTGIFYAQGVKANVLFFDRKPASPNPWTRRMWVYDLRTNQHFTLKTRPMKRADLDDFVSLYKAGALHEREPTWAEDAPEGRWRAYDYDELVNRDKCSLDLTWLKDDSLLDAENLPEPDVIAGEIAEDLRVALGQIEEILGDLGVGA